MTMGVVHRAAKSQLEIKNGKLEKRIMTDQHQSRSAAQFNKNNRSKAKSVLTTERTEAEVGLSQWPAKPLGMDAADVRDPVLAALQRGPAGSFSGGSLDIQAARLGDSRLQTAQRQGLAAQIGRMQGNKHLQRVVASTRGHLKRDQAAAQERPEPVGELLERSVAQSSVGHQMEPGTLAEAERLFDQDLGDVRIHDNAEANELAMTLQTQAFSTGRDIFFAQGVYRPDTASGARVLGHELTHVAEGDTRGKVAFWGGSDHEKLTMKAATEIMPSEGFFINSLMFYSKMMDLRPRRLIKVAGPGIAHYGVKYAKKLAGLLSPLAGPLIQQIPVPKILPEGPEHGEDGNYRTTDVATAKAMNIAEQNKHLNQAIELGKQYKQALSIPTGTAREKLDKLAAINKQIVKRLGDALHIAQDRGSHREGVKGKGHDDPRPEEVYNCDNPGHNAEGYQEALSNSREVLKEYSSGTKGS